jgi:hypothetical protein
MHDALADLRRTRRERRLGDLEWFDLAYRVYLAAIFGGGAVIVISDFVGDAELTANAVARVFDRGPSLLGLMAVLAVAMGMRSGAGGGPVSVESADVQHLLLAPVARHQVLTRPLVQRLRSVAFAAAIAGAIAGQLAAQRLPGSPAAWAASGALAAAACGALFVASATVAHALALPRVLATALAAALVGVQLATIITRTAGPGDPFGHLAMQGGGDHDGFGDPGTTAAMAGAAVFTALLVGVALAMVGGLRIDPLVRRGELVSQLRFAVTMQDLRTVVLLRRQLREELARNQPWFGQRRAGSTAVDRPTTGTGGATITGARSSPSQHHRPLAGPARVAWRRGWRSLARTPMSRLVRMATVAAAAGVAASAVLEGTTPAVVVLGVMLFVLGLDVLEPLSQEIDHPARTDALPVERAVLHLGLLSAPLVALVPLALIGAAVVVAFDPARWPAALALAVPVTWLGAAGSVVNVVRDAPSRATGESVMLPPEFAGFSTAVRTLLPVLISMLATVPVVAMRADPSIDTGVRSLIGCALALTALGWWIRRRDQWRDQWTAAISGAKPS